MSSYSGVYVFGDSLVDPSNDLKVAELIGRLDITDLPNGAPTADKGYYLGRFTDGYNFADLVSNKVIGQTTQATFPYGITNTFLGVSIGAVTRPGGNNLSFAYGGAKTSQDDPAPSLDTQVSIYHNFTADPNALYIISMGSNDILSLVPTGGTPVTGAAATNQLSSVASAIAFDVIRLLGQGAGHVLVANVPDLGVTPAYAGPNEASQRALLTQYAQIFDADLKADLNAIAVPAGATLTDFDTFAYSDAATANPAAYDFTNVTQALTAAQPNGPDPTGAGYLFFDNLHPTAQAHAQIASLMLDQLAGVTPVWTHAAAIGAQAGAAIAQPGQVDDFQASLLGGETYVVDALGISSHSGTLSDPQVRVLDAAGNVVAQGDDGGVGFDTHMLFTVPASGGYTIEVSGVGVTAGSFHLQLADQAGSNLLTTGALVGSNEDVEAGATNDTLVAAGGTNTLSGGQGEDSITGGSGFDRVNGNQGDDTIVGRSAVGDSLLGGQGNDSIGAGQATGHDFANGNLGNDTLMGGAGGDTLRGGQGDDIIVGGAGADWISGDLGHNTLTGGGGADTFHAGAGVDVVTDFSTAIGDHVQVDAGVTYTLSQSGPDTVIAFSNGGQMTLQGVQSSSLASGWIVSV